MNDLAALQTAARLQALGVVVNSPELAATAGYWNEFFERGGNRAMRRAAHKGIGRRPRSKGRHARAR